MFSINVVLRYEAINSSPLISSSNFNISSAFIVSIILFIVGVLMLFLCKKGTRFDNLYKDKEEKDILF